MSNMNPAGEMLEITFDHDNAHMALCHRVQGYGANGRPEALLIKSDEVELTEEVMKDIDLIKATSEVRIDTNMMTFLRKWMGMYYEDAEALSRIMGYEGDGEEVSDWIAGRIEGITLLKSNLSEGHREAITQEDVTKLEDFMKTVDLEKNSFSEGDSEVKIEIKKSHKPSEENLNNNQGELMSQTDVEKLEKAQTDLADMEARLAEFEKKAEEEAGEREALASKVADFEKAALARKEAVFTKAVEEYSFVTPEEKVDFSKALMKLDSLDGEVAELVVATLDKAQVAVNAIDETQGSDDAEGVDLEKSSTSLEDKLLAKYGDK